MSEFIADNYFLGADVTLKEDSVYYNQCRGMDGKLVDMPYRVLPHEWCRIEWEDGSSNNYELSDVIILESADLPHRLLPGQEVIIKQTGETGIVTFSHSEYSRIAKGSLSFTKVQHRLVRVITYNSTEIIGIGNVKYSDLEILPNCFKDLRIYNFFWDWKDVVIEGIDNKSLTRKIIVERKPCSTMLYINEEVREKLLNYLNN